MASKKTCFLLFLVAFSLVVDNTEAGWKFWKKKKTEEEPTSTTVAPSLPGSTAPANTGSVTGDTRGIPASGSPAKPAVDGKAPAGNKANPQPSAGAPSIGTRGAIAAAANPGLAVGVANSGPNIRANAQPSRPNPGTEVGLDIPGAKPGKPGTGPTSGQNYRDWAVDLTGAGDGTKPAPKLPAQGPAVTGNGPKTPTGNVPGSPVTTPNGQPTGNNNRQPPPVTGPRPGSPSPSQPGSPTSSRPGTPSSPHPGTPSSVSGPGNSRGSPAATPVNPQPAAAPGGSQVSTLHVGSLNPGKTGNPQPGTPSSGYVSPGSSVSGGSLTPGGKSWAEVAGNGGNAKPSSPTPAPRPSSSVQPGRTGSPGQASLGTGAAVAAGAIAAGAATTGKKQYSSNPRYSPGNTVTDEDLEKLSEALFIKDTNNANRYITLNLQKQTTSANTADLSPEPLLNVNSQALQIPTIQRVLSIYDNYKLDSRIGEYISPKQREEESLLVDTFLSTDVMAAAMRFLADKGVIRKDYYEYKDTLRRLWFNLYSRGGDGKIGSAGFEHVFLVEHKLGTEVSGLHNWIYFNAEEVAKRADYLGYIKKVDLGDKAAILKIHAKHNNIDKPVTTMFIGTSPELEMALYTVCFLTRSEKPCPVSLGGTKFNIITHKFRYRGYDLIGSAYPEI